MNASQPRHLCRGQFQLCGLGVLVRVTLGAGTGWLALKNPANTPYATPDLLRRCACVINEKSAVVRHIETEVGQGASLDLHARCRER